MTDLSAQLGSFPHRLNVLICGGGRGIGMALVRRLRCLSRVNYLFASGSSLESVLSLNAMARHGGKKLYPLTMDLSWEHSVRAAADIVSARVDRLDLIINCCGILHNGADMQPEKQLQDIDPVKLQRAYAVNAIGPLLLAKYFRELLPRRGRVVFLNLSARVGSIGDNRSGGWYSYRASKAAQNMITKNLSIEMRRRATGLICIAMHPGTVDTFLSKPFLSNVSNAKLFQADEAAGHILSVVDRLDVDDNGSFFSWDATKIPW